MIKLQTYLFLGFMFIYTLCSVNALLYLNSNDLYDFLEINFIQFAISIHITLN